TRSRRRIRGQLQAVGGQRRTVSGPVARQDDGANRRRRPEGDLERELTTPDRPCISKDGVRKRVEGTQLEPPLSGVLSSRNSRPKGAGRPTYGRQPSITAIIGDWFTNQSLALMARSLNVDLISS